jgi:hypothetical protein
LSVNATLAALRTVIAATGTWRELCGIAVVEGEVTEEQAQEAAEARILIFGRDDSDTAPALPFAHIRMDEVSRRPTSVDGSELRGVMSMVFYVEREAGQSWDADAGALAATMADLAEELETAALTTGRLNIGQIDMRPVTISDRGAETAIWECPGTVAFPREF